MNRLMMASDEQTWESRPIVLRPAIDAVVIYEDETIGGSEVTFLSDPNGDPLMAIWSADFEEWSVYYSE